MTKEQLLQQQELSAQFDIEFDQVNQQLAKLQEQNNEYEDLVKEIRTDLLIEQEKSNRLQLSSNKYAFELQELKLQSEFNEEILIQKNSFLEQKLETASTRVEILKQQQSEKNQMIANLETEINNLQIGENRSLNQNDKAWLSQFLAKQQSRFDEWQTTKKSILTQVVQQGLLNELRDPLEELLIEEDFLTNQEQLQLATWGINFNKETTKIINTSDKDSEYAYTSLYDNTSTVEGNPLQAGKVVNNEVQGSFVFKAQNTEVNAAPATRISLAEQEKQAFLDYYKQGLTQQAIEKGQSILALNPSDSKMIYNMSLLHVKRKEFEQAKTYAQQLKELSADNYQGHYLQGLIAYYQQDIEQAKTALEKAITLNPEFGSAWLYFGHLLNYSQEYPEAKQAFEKVIKFQGESSSVYYNLAVLSQKVNKPKEGVYYYQKSLDLGGKIDADLANRLLLSAQ